MSDTTETTPFDLAAAIAEAEERQAAEALALRQEQVAEAKKWIEPLKAAIRAELAPGLIEATRLTFEYDPEEGVYATFTEDGVTWTIQRTHQHGLIWWIRAQVATGFAPETPEVDRRSAAEGELQYQMLLSISRVQRTIDSVLAPILERLDYMNRADDVLDRIRAALAKAIQKHPPLNTAHEAASVIFEEFVEFYQLVMADQPAGMAAELDQLAAMCIRAQLDRNLPLK